MLLVLAVVLLGWLVSIGIDLLFAPLPMGVRFGILGVWMLAVLWALVRGLGPSFKKLDLIRIARWLEHRHPEIEERLSTALELRDDKRASRELITMLLEAADADADRVDPKAEVTAGSSTKRWRWVVAACVIVMLGFLIAMPQQAARLMWRAVAPLSDVGNAGAVEFVLRPEGLEVLEGEAIEIRVIHDGVPEMELELASGESVVQAMVEDGDEWVYRLEPARESFRYRARSGRAESDAFQATVWPTPRMMEGSRTLEFPGYTDLAPASHGLQGPLEAVVGTVLTVEGMLNTPVTEAWIEMGDGSRVEAGLEVSAERSWVKAGWTLGEVGRESVGLVVKHRLGKEIEALRFDVVTLADEVPVVVLLQPARDEIRVRPDEVLDLRYEVAEDFGVHAVEVMVDVKGKGGFGLEQWLPEPIASTGIPRFRGAASVSVGVVLEQSKGARQFRLRVMAADARPEEAGGPGRGYSDWLLVKVDQGAESLARQELRAAGEDARKTLEEAMQETREAEQMMHQNRGHLEKAEENRWAEQLSEETTEKLTAAEEKLEELAKRMEEGIHAKESSNVEEAAAKVAEALEAFEEVPLQDDRPERKEKLDEAVAAAREAVKQMEEVRRSLEKARPQVEDLARVEELAQRQEELARKAEAMNEETVSEDWQREQEQMAAELRSQLEQRPEAMAEALKAQSERAAELAEEGEHLAEEQAQLEEMVSESAQTPDAESLREAIAEAQNELAEEVREAATEEAEGSQPDGSKQEVIERMEEAAEALASKEQSEQQAAEATREAADAMMASADEGAAEEGAAEEGAAEEGAAEEGAADEGAADEGAADEGAADEGAADEAVADREAEKGTASAEDSERPAEPSSDGSSEAAASEEQMARQEKLADAAEALAEGNLEEAAEALEEAQAGGEGSAADELGEMLAEAQAGISEEVGELLAEARQELSPLADVLPESVAETQQASAALEQGDLEAAAGETAQAQAALEAAAEEAMEVAGESAEPGEAAQQQATEAAAMGTALDELGERQQAVAEAAQALAEGDVGKAMQQLQAMQAMEAQEFSDEVAAMTDMAGSSLDSAKQAAAQGSREAAEAAEQSAQGQSGEAAQSHGEASEALQKAAESLAKASSKGAEKAEKLAQKDSSSNQAPVDAAAMAQAFQEASEAKASTDPAQAAANAAAAAEALSEAAEGARSAMQGKPQPGPPGPPQGMAAMPGDQAGEDPSGEERQPQADPGVPEELAKLGVSASDWEKIQATLQSDVGAGEAGVVPEDYRELVKDYFQNMAK
ncbi:hypothetical protein [Haloferula rosea]|uniref:DUF4175 family protein n=1 Tax=Haloferula rosea TaxID=490093 RepID=A0A934VCZ2_9BACT|nr:hypothetical protein [Haloferula rosea]MBK1828963.1 hypothetical protein [Haloferula rosea]